MIDAISEAIRQEPIPVMAIVMGTLTGLGIVVAKIVSKAWQVVRANEADAALKQEMLDRGMSAEEIERVIRASSKPGR
jgi:hypothetical protein